jgi:hypothetical protein
MPGGVNVKLTVEGTGAVVVALRALAAKAGPPRPQVTVGYKVDYAMHVHENMETYHANGQAKFLEQPARVHEHDMARIVADAVRAGGTLAEGELAAGRFLLEQSKALVPVRTGALRDSGFCTAEGAP